jgi:hypothetical protein
MLLSQPRHLDAFIAESESKDGDNTPGTVPPTPLRAAGHTVTGRLTKGAVYWK